MKKIPFLNGWLIFLIFAVALVTSYLLIKRWRLAGSLHKILSFQNARIEECIVEVLPGRLLRGGDEPAEMRGSSHTEAIAELGPNEATELAENFSRIVKKSCTEVLIGDRISLIYDYRITFKSHDYIWKYRFSYFPHGTSVDYELRSAAEPVSSCYGVMTLGKAAGPELESFITSKLTAK